MVSACRVKAPSWWAARKRAHESRNQGSSLVGSRLSILLMVSKSSRLS